MKMPYLINVVQYWPVSKNANYTSSNRQTNGEHDFIKGGYVGFRAQQTKL